MFSIEGARIAALDRLTGGWPSILETPFSNLLHLHHLHHHRIISSSTMIARRFVANSPIRAHLLRSPRRPLKLPLSLSSRSYSESDPSRSTQGPQSSKHEEGDWKSEVRTNWKGWAKAVVGTGFGTSFVGINFFFFFFWKYAKYRRLLLYTSPAIYGFQIRTENIRDIHMSLNAIPQSTRLSKKDLCFRMISTILSRAKPLSMKSGRLLHQLSDLVVIHFVIGEHGTGKTSLIYLAVNSLEEPKGIAYVDIPNNINKDSALDVVINAMRNALGWTLDPVIESKRRK